MKVRAPAKINLFLEVVRRRKDGYHDIETVFQTVSLFDELTFSKRAEDGIELDCGGAKLSGGPDNLVYRAAELLKSRLGVKQGVKITLKKRIPMGAGLGGGSSDAAATLKGLLKLWHRRLPAKELVKMASSLGADVAFFLYGGTAAASGVGDRVKRLKPIKSTWFLLVNPRIHIPTPMVYKRLQFPLTNKQKINKIEWRNCLFNRLEEAVLPRFGAVRKIKDVLGRLGCPGLMSGSGSTVFAPVPSKTEGERMRKELKRFPWDVWLVRSTG
jgi:4-diphosphocytidyl-2-C-methyl-D-erythritol kinase